MLVRLDSGNVNSDKLGNKGKFLGLMRQKGFNVPAGFVLDSDTYDETVSGTAGEVIRNTLSCLNKDNVSDTEILLKELFADMRLPESVREELKRNLSSDKLYAVRSSGTKEDLAEFSFAGQYQTFLNTKPADVEAKVIECYRSMF